MPLSFAAMLGGSLTLVGSSINLVAADVAAQTLGRRISMFEFTPLGLLVFGAGLLYLMTVGRRLVPARIAPAASLTEGYDLDRHLARVRVRESSPLVGETATEVFVTADADLDVSVLQVERTAESRREDDGEVVVRTVTETFPASAARPIEAEDVLVVRGNTQEVNDFATAYDCRQLPRETVTDADLEADHPGMLAEVVVPEGSWLVGESPVGADLRRRFATTVLGVRRGGSVLREDLDDRAIREGDTLLVRTTDATLEYLREEAAVLLVQEARPREELPRFAPDPPELSGRAPLTVGVLVAAVMLAAFTPIGIPVTALGGVVVLVATGSLTAAEAYDAVSWNVVFLLAGVLPLGIAVQRTGGAAAIGDQLATLAAVLPDPLVLTLFYLVAGLVAAVVTPVATVVLLVPVAVQTAAELGLDGFSVLLSTFFGASAAYITPIGYQTNLMVYGPGGYRFTDFLRVGLPMQVFLAGVTTLGLLVLFPP
jgi:di/tricarboxylate transporter